MKFKLIKILTLICIVFVLISFTTKYFSEPIYFEIPKNWPKPEYNFKNNTLTEEGFLLGKTLFYDPILSKDNTISCASCHLQQTGFTHVDHDLSHGIEGRIGIRNTLTLQNLAWSKNFMYDGAINNLEVQALGPISNHNEMDESIENIVTKLNTSTAYKKLFYNAFQTKQITGQYVLKAITQFVVSLKSSNSKYDRVKNGLEIFTEKEQKGYNLFKIHCSNCHKEPLFTNDDFKNNGLPLDETLNDFGRMLITKNSKDSLLFKVPTLRNIEFTFPYMHDGRFKTLAQVIKHYNNGIQESKTLSKELEKPMNLTDNERVELISFLKTLTDKEFLFNPKFSYPK